MTSMGLMDKINKFLARNKISRQQLGAIVLIFNFLLALASILPFFGIQFSTIMGFYESLSVDTKVSLWGILNMVFTYFIYKSK